MGALTSWPAGQLCLSSQERRDALQAVQRAFASTLESLKVDLGLMDMFESIYVPLGAWIACHHRTRGQPLVVGINGAQGAGKSTLFNLLEVILSEGFGLKVVGFSIDDLYKTHAERQQLGRDVHPLLQTRGVPGTHDVGLGVELIRSLKNSCEATITKIPVFDKSIDDRCPPSAWQEWFGPADVIVLEGWCVGAAPQDDVALSLPVNELERHEDLDGAWRRYVNDQLKDVYPQLFDELDLLVMLKVPSMDSVFEWRSLQEKKLAERVKYIYDTQQPTDHLKIMTEEQIVRFIQHYERLTRHMLEELAPRADVTLKLNQNHKIHKIFVNSPLGCLN